MPNIAHTIFTNAKIFTANPLQPAAQAVAVRGNRIVCVGNNADALAWRGDNTRAIDAQNNTLLPGINDAHFHLLHGSLHLDAMSFDGVRDYDALAAVIKKFASENPEREWLNGFQLMYHAVRSTPLTRQHLDAVQANRPIVIIAYDGHTAWANTNALQRGILRGGECGPNSEIVLDEHGEATGELREPGAFRHVTNLLPEPDAHRKRALLQKGLRAAAELGVTSVQNMDLGMICPRSSQRWMMWANSLCESICHSTSNHTLLLMLLRAMPLTCAPRFTRIKCAGSLKFFMDGVIEAYTGLLVDPYADNPNTNGDANYTPEHFNRMAVEGDRLGFQIFVHAVGDAAVRRVLDGYELAQKQTANATVGIASNISKSFIPMTLRVLRNLR